MTGVPAWAWVIWAAISIGAFAILETVALIDRRDGDTLSEVIRRWLGIRPPRPIRRIAIPIFVSALIAFTIWFVPHIAGR